MATAGSGWGRGKLEKDSEETSEACAKEEPSKASREREWAELEPWGEGRQLSLPQGSGTCLSSGKLNKL